MASSVCRQLGRPYLDELSHGKSIAYHNCHHELIIPIVFDTGCSMSIISFREDFVSKIDKPKCPQIKGVGEAVHSITGVGTIQWDIYDMHGKELTIQTIAYLVPSADIRLLSPQAYYNEQRAGDNSAAYIDREGVTLILDSEGNMCTFPYHCHNNILYMLPSAKHQNCTKGKMMALLNNEDMLMVSNPTCMAQLFSVADKTNQNLTAAQRELLI